VKFGRTIGVAVLVMVLALIPLSTLISPGQFEIQFPHNGASFEVAYTVTLGDRTGRAKGLAVALPDDGIGPEIRNYGPDGRILIIDLEGTSCDLQTDLELLGDGPGFILRRRTQEGSCAIGTGMIRAVAISLWAPIDASTVRIENLD
jgi:hypothetical protein